MHAMKNKRYQKLYFFVIPEFFVNKKDGNNEKRTAHVSVPSG